MRKYKFTNTLSSIFMFVIIICAIGLVVYLTTDMSSVVSNISSPYLVIDNEEIKEHSSGYMLDVDKPLTVDIKQNINLGSSNQEYTVNIIPNALPEYNFEVTANGESYPYQSMGDLTSGFDIVKSDSTFTITPKGGINTILSCAYPNTSIDDCTEKAYKNMYTLVVTFADGDTSITVDFSVAEHYNAITLDMSNIIL